MIHFSGHKCVFCAPYYPVGNAIEHVFNTIQGEKRQGMYHIQSHEDVIEEFYACVRNLQSFSGYFAHVGIN